MLDSLVILLAVILNPIAKRRGYWIGDKPNDQEAIAEGGSAAAEGASAAALRVRPTRSRVSSSGAHGGQLMPSLSPSLSTANGANRTLQTSDTQDTAVDSHDLETPYKEREVLPQAAEAEGRGAGAHAAGAAGMEGVRRVEHKLGMS